MCVCIYIYIHVIWTVVYTCVCLYTGVLIMEHGEFVGVWCTHTHTHTHRELFGIQQYPVCVVLSDGDWSVHILSLFDKWRFGCCSYDRYCHLEVTDWLIDWLIADLRNTTCVCVHAGCSVALESLKFCMFTVENTRNSELCGTPGQRSLKHI